MRYPSYVQVTRTGDSEAFHKSEMYDSPIAALEAVTHDIVADQIFDFVKIECYHIMSEDRPHVRQWVLTID